MSLIAPYALALLAGVISFTSPCCLPLMPGYVSFVSGVDRDGTETGSTLVRSRTMMAATLFVLGFTRSTLQDAAGVNRSSDPA